MPLPPLYEKSLSDASSFSDLLSECSLIICLEFLDSGIGQRMFCHLNDNFIRNGGNISSCQRAVGHMDRVADAGCDDLGVDIFCHIKNVCDLTNQVDAVAGDGLAHRAGLERLADELAAQYDVVMATEIGGGIVPLEAEQRRAREAAGRLACLLAARADTVIEMFCGIATVLKGEMPC